MRPHYSALARRMGPAVVKPEPEDLGTVEAADDESATRGGSPGPPATSPVSYTHLTLPTICSV